MTNQIETMMGAVVDHGYRLTNARRVIIETLVASEGHITADALAEMVRRKAPQVGRMTVYRTLDMLTELGAIRPIYQGTGAASFILLPGGSHHHMICNLCHEVIEFDHCTANEIAQQLAERYQFHVSSHLLELHGICQSCLVG